VDDVDVDILAVHAADYVAQRVNAFLTLWEAEAARAVYRLNRFARWLVIVIPPEF